MFVVGTCVRCLPQNSDLSQKYVEFLCIDDMGFYKNVLSFLLTYLLNHSLTHLLTYLSTYSLT